VSNIVKCAYWQLWPEIMGLS